MKTPRQDRGKNGLRKNKPKNPEEENENESQGKKDKQNMVDSSPNISVSKDDGLNLTIIKNRLSDF